ncbi:hypothetical protein V3C99_018603 [Haemonchus contortus]|uniref:Integrase_H2C2 domain-containing protein n=1 Tax=Haemonchus contortus TaxID=6289 RepID=A0A7I5EDX4_HAECO
MFKEMNMNLRGFQTNNAEVNAMTMIPDTDRSTKKISKVLGIVRDSNDDQIHIRVSLEEKPRYTKRSVCEQIASIFVPMGWLTPVMVQGKLFLQELWRQQYDWETIIAEHHENEWRRIVAIISGCEFQLPRMVLPEHAQATLAIFADASCKALAACAYLVAGDESHLMFNKSRLPNAKDSPTIPKMEMNAITLATRIAYMLYQALESKITITSIKIFSDSQISLSWLATNPIRKEVGVLVKKRVTEIRSTVRLMEVPVRFGYVETAKNPADCATRGLTAEEMKSHSWWRGPEFLKYPEETGDPPYNTFELPEDTEGESIDMSKGKNENQSTCMSASTNLVAEELLDWKRHNTLDTAQSAVAYALRFLQRVTCKLKTDLKSRIEEKIPELRESHDSTYITARERNNAMEVIIRNHQCIHVNDNLRRSTKNSNLQEDKKKLLRCNGRFEQANMPESRKKPLFIVAKTPLAQCIIRQAHLPSHLGTSHTMTKIREQFWIPKLRQQV